MKAIILCAGYATRLMPLTAENPKALLPVSGKPILNHIVEKIDRIPDVDSIYIVSNNKFYMKFAWWLTQNQSNFSKEITLVDSGSVSVEDQKGWFHDTLLAINQNSINDDLLIIAGDNLFDLNLNEFITFFNIKKSPCLVCYKLSNKEDVNKFGVVEINNDNKIIDIEEKPENPKSDLIVTAIYALRKKDIFLLKSYFSKMQEQNRLKPGHGMTHFVIDNYQTIDFFALPFKGLWIDIGSKEDYEKIK